ncbi:MAG: PQQ-binding-like beta-propeller repeat protein [Planctomycetaceae bacterium]|nr:PQQ-binding-like beta-propeller repeat protein [Planctomycetaceae bacterium]
MLGPNRDGIAVGETLAERWSQNGPESLWQQEVGSGFAGVAVAGDRVILFDREGPSEVVRCLDSESGKQLWKSESPCRYQGGVSGDKGPRCVPLIAGHQVFTFGVEGRLQCLAVDDGKTIWQRDTTKDFRPLEGYFGVGSTPVLYKNLLIVNVGGRADETAIVAFDASSGKTAWTSFTDHASYSSPIVADIGGAPTAVVVTRLNVTGLNPETGKILFTFPFGARGPTVNGATPVVLGNHIFLSASYNIGSLLLRFDGQSATEVRRDEELLATQYATAVKAPRIPGVPDRIVFAIDGRQDSGRGSASLKCIDVIAGKVLWEEPGLDYGTVIRSSNDLIILTCTGELIRAEASPGKYSEKSRHTVLNATDSGYRLPALSGGRLYIRDDSVLKCLQVGK